jgi:branched-chain amino acid transport system permease protein
MTQVRPILSRPVRLFALMALLFVLTGLFEGWPFALRVLNFSLIYAVIALGLNIQWGYAGLFNVGIVGFVALGGLAVVLVSSDPVPEAMAAGGPGIVLAIAIAAATVIGAVVLHRRMAPGRLRTVTLIGFLIGGFILYRSVFDPAVQAIETFNPATYGNIGGLGLPTLLSWPAGGLLAAGAAWLVAKTALGLRSDYLAIATLGIAWIIGTAIGQEDWLSRGVKNIIGLPRPVPFEVDLQVNPTFLALAERWNADPVALSGLVVALSWTLLFLCVLIPLVILMELALKSPWGRMMRAIRDNEVAAEAMGKDVTRRHLQVFVLGAAVMGVAGAMYVSYLGQLTPNTYVPLTFTFLIWVMVIVGGSGNNWGSVLGGLLIWWMWNVAEPLGTEAMSWITASLPEGGLKTRLMESVAHMRLLTVGVLLLLVLRFSPRGLLPEK